MTQDKNVVEDVKVVAEIRTEAQTEAHSAAVDVDVVVISEEKEIAKSVTLLPPKSVLTKRWRLTG